MAARQRRPVDDASRGIGVSWGIVVVVVGVIVGGLAGCVGGQDACTFPSDIRGNWTSSRMGVLDFINDTHISGRVACTSCTQAEADAWTCVANEGDKYIVYVVSVSSSSLDFLNDTHISGRVACTSCTQAEADAWTCVANEGDKYIVSTSVPDIGSSVYFFTCLYLYRHSATKYVYYYGPQTKHSSLDDYVIVQNDPNFDMDTVCDLSTPFPADRYHLLVREDSLTTSSSLCPSDILGNFVANDPTSCDANIEVCGDQNSIQVTNSTIAPDDLFYSVNGSALCMYSQSDGVGGVTYLTVYNMDDTLTAGDTGFVCVAILKSGDLVSLTQQKGECVDLDTPDVTTPLCVFNATVDCPVTCEFSSSLIGSWVSTRKGDVIITSDTMTGFEPAGVDCNTTACNNATSSFHCYMKDSSKYLIRTEPIYINSETVRIYVCLSFSQESSQKYIYHHDHSDLHTTLDEYLVTLNSAAPVDAMTDVCEGITSFDPALYTVFMKSDSVSASVQSCPSQLEKIYNVSNSQCEYTLGTCDDSTQVKLSSTTCSPLPFYTENGTLGCLYSTTSGDTTYLTLYNTDNDYTPGDTYMFTCMAYTVSDSSTLQFSQTPFGCHKNQSSTSVTTDDGMTFVFDSLGGCPTSDEFPWIYIVIAIAALLFLIILIVILWYCCCKRKRKRRKGKEGRDDESVLSRGSEDSRDEDGPKKSPVRRLFDVFTVGKGKDKKTARERDLERSKLKHGKKGHRGDEESLDSGVTGDEAGKTRKRRRKRKKRKRKRRKRTLDDGTEEYVTSSDADDDDGYNDIDSEYSDTFESDDDGSYTDTDGSDSSQKKRTQQPTSNKSKAHQLHIAKAWEKRKNDPSLVKSAGSPVKGRVDVAARVEGDFDPQKDLLPGQIAPISSALVRGSPLRNRDRTGSRMSSARANIRYISSPTRHKPSIDERLEEARDRYVHNIPHLGLYLDYTDKRLQLEDEGFWDDSQALRTASRIFNLNELDDALEADEGGKTNSKGGDPTKQSADQASIPGTASRPSTSSHRGDHDSKSEDTQTTVMMEDTVSNSTRPPSRRDTLQSVLSAGLGHPDHAEKESGKTENKDIQTVSDDEFESNIVAPSIADYDCPIDIKSPAPQEEKVTFVGSAKVMARFYSRLNQIRNAKTDTDSSGTPPEATPTEKTDRRRIRTALRRLLNERLFPDIKPITPVRPLPSSNGDTTELDFMTSGTATPFTPGTRSRSRIINTSGQISKNDDNNGDEKRQSTAGSKGRVLFVETSDLSEDTFTTGDVTIPSPSQKQVTPGYYRRNEGPITNPNSRSRLYQPARGHGAQSAWGSSTSSRDAIFKDPDFIKSLRSQIGKHNDKSSGPPSSTTGPSARPHMSWAYNNLSRTRGPAPRRVNHSYDGGMSREEMEDWQLKKLLEELYQDKKYMDTLISTKGDNATEEEVTKSVQEGREYLLERAAYWLDKGPLPPRPPTSELGFRLEREQSVMSVRSVKGMSP